MLRLFLQKRWCLVMAKLKKGIPLASLTVAFWLCSPAASGGSIYNLTAQAPVHELPALALGDLSRKVKLTLDYPRSFDRTGIKDRLSYLEHNLILQPQNLSHVAFIIQRVEGAGSSFKPGDHFYSWGQFDFSKNQYHIAQRAGTYLDPITNELLGLEMTAKGAAELVASYPDITVFKITSLWESIGPGDQLIPINLNADEAADVEDMSHIPKLRTPDLEINGQVLGILNLAKTQKIIKDQEGTLIAINQGLREGLERGDKLTLYTEENSIGSIVVLKVFDKMSYGLVFESTRPTKIGDLLRAP